MKSAREILSMLAAPDLPTYLQATARAYEAYNLPAEFELLLRLEREGGPCPRCGKAWERVEVTVPWGDKLTYYFDPACECFPRCPECGVSWHREVAANNTNLDRCSSCNWQRHPIYQRLCRVCGQGFRTRDPAHKVCALCVGKQGRPADRGLDRLFESVPAEAAR